MFREDGLFVSDLRDLETRFNVAKSMAIIVALEFEAEALIVKVSAMLKAERAAFACRRWCFCRWADNGPSAETILESEKQSMFWKFWRKIMTEIKNWFRITKVCEQIARALSGAVTQWLAEGVLVRGGSTLLYAPPGQGKSLAAMDLALAATEGRLWLGAHHLGEPMHTIYLDDDGNNDHEFNARLLSFGARADNEYLHCMMHQGFIVTDDAQRAALLRYCKEHLVQLLIIDSFTRIHRLGEASSGDMKQVSAAIKQFCLAGITVVVLHHSTKGGATFRGSNEIASGFDGVLRLEKTDDYTFLLTNEKVRSVGKQGFWKGCRIVVGEDDNGNLRLDGTEMLGDEASTSAVQEALRSSILDLLMDDDMHATALKKALKLSSREYGSFDAAIEWLVAEGMIESNKQGKAVVYTRCADAEGVDGMLGD